MGQSTFSTEDICREREHHGGAGARGSQETPGKWGEDGDKLEPFCRNSKEKVVQKATDFWHEETKTQRNDLTSI